MTTTPSDFAVHVAPGSHLDDADMLRHLDNEPALSTIGDAVVHLRDCVACAARADVLRRRRMALAFLLADADVAAAPMAVPKALLDRARARSRWHASPALRAAAALLVAGSLAAQPAVRRWVSLQWDRAAGIARATPSAGVPVSPRVAPSATIGGASGAVLSFEPGRGAFTIRFDAPPTAGSLSIVSDTGTLATVERLGGDNLEVLVISHGLSVRNAPGQTVFYRVRLPHRVARVYLRSGHTTSLGDQVITVSDSVVRIYFGSRRSR